MIAAMFRIGHNNPDRALLGGCLLALCLFAGPALGAATHPAESSAWELVHPTDLEWQDRAQRRAIAQDLQDRVRLLADAVPPQSPRERSKVVEQLAEFDALAPGEAPRKRGRFYLSRPYQHYRLRAQLSGLLSDLACAVETGEVATEMRCWAAASARFLDEERISQGLETLRRSRLVPRDGNMPVLAQDPTVWYSEYARGILQHLLVPYLAEVAGRGVGPTKGAP